jgi:hypothetical protein
MKITIQVVCILAFVVLSLALTNENGKSKLAITVGMIGSMILAILAEVVWKIF